MVIKNNVKSTSTNSLKIQGIFEKQDPFGHKKA